MGDVEVRPSRIFVTDHLVQCDGKEYPTGTEFPESEMAPEVIAQLRKLGAIKLREEIEAADKLAAERVALESELAEVKARLAEALAAQSGEAPKAKAASSKASAPAAPAAAEDAPAQ